MRKRTRSILEELNSLRSSADADRSIEMTANNIIESSINLLSKIHQNYDEVAANELERRFLNSIRSGDARKFKRGMDKIMESKKNDNQ